MMRSRLLWFAMGFSVSGGAVSQLVWRDLFAQRYALSSDMKQKFEGLEHRVLSLEAGPSSSTVEA